MRRRRLAIVNPNNGPRDSFDPVTVRAVRRESLCLCLRRSSRNTGSGQAFQRDRLVEKITIFICLKVTGWQVGSKPRSSQAPRASVCWKVLNTAVGQGYVPLTHVNVLSPTSGTIGVQYQKGCHSFGRIRQVPIAGQKL